MGVHSPMKCQILSACHGYRDQKYISLKNLLINLQNFKRVIQSGLLG